MSKRSLKEHGSVQAEYALILVVVASVLVTGWWLVASGHVGRLAVKRSEGQQAAAKELLWLF